MDGVLVEQPGDAVGELDLAPGAATYAREVIEHLGHQQVAADHGQGRGRLGGSGFLDDGGDALCGAPPLRRDDAVLVGLGSRYDLAADDAAAALRVYGRHLREHRLRGIDEIVGEMHEERPVAHRRPRAEDRMPEPERRGLPDVDAGGVARQHAAQLPQQL
jgi:hypothetical protein